MTPGQFSPEFREELAALMRWRRDVRRFRTDPVPEDILARALQAFTLAPSVGLSEPWRVLRIDSPARRAACLANFSDCNAEALNGFDGDRAATYSRLKLSGMAEAPVHLAVFCDDATPKGHLGAYSSPSSRSVTRQSCERVNQPCGHFIAQDMPSSGTISDNHTVPVAQSTYPDTSPSQIIGASSPKGNA